MGTQGQIPCPVIPWPSSIAPQQPSIPSKRVPSTTLCYASSGTVQQYIVPPTVTKGIVHNDKSKF